ncbi:MAG: hypothetical protein H7338_03030 [Candidatus Sericytochromatia bacterium]|nr:hypothetical protein [Candidatus Sericytochromatia bacterium]
MPINEYATVDSFYSLSKWIGDLNNQAKNSASPGYKADRVTFTGGATSIAPRPGGQSVQTGEGSLSIINYTDFSQGKIAGSYRPYHLAVKGDGFFTLVPPTGINKTTGAYVSVAGDKLLVTRDGEFKRDAGGLLVHTRTGMYLATTDYNGAGWTANGIRAVYDNSAGVAAPPAMNRAVSLTNYFSQDMVAATVAANGTTALGQPIQSLLRFPGDTKYLSATKTNPTVFDFGHVPGVLFHDTRITTMGTSSVVNSLIVPMALENSNAPIEQMAPELAQAQRMYDNLTKILSARKSNFELLTSLFR